MSPHQGKDVKSTSIREQNGIFSLYFLNIMNDIHNNVIKYFFDHGKMLQLYL